MPTTVNPSVVLVHGAWFSAQYWDPVMAELKNLDASAVAVELPLAGFATDVAVARQAIEMAGPGAVVVGHSYGGCVVSAAAAELPSVARLVYVAAFLTTIDERPAEILVEYQSELLDALVVTDAGVGVDVEKARHVFFGDADDDTGLALAARLRPMSLEGADMEYHTHPAWESVPSTYVMCTRDRALPLAAQRFMAARANETLEWPTDHSPFVGRSKDLAQLLVSYLS